MYIANRGVFYLYNVRGLVYNATCALTCIRDVPKITSKLYLLNKLISLTYYLQKV